MSLKVMDEQLLLDLDREADDDRDLDSIMANARRRFDKAVARERRPAARVGAAPLDGFGSVIGACMGWLERAPAWSRRHGEAE